jgi:hypothetical protein
MQVRLFKWGIISPAAGDLRAYAECAAVISALQIIFVYKKQENNLRKALIPPCGVLEFFLAKERVKT